MSDEKLSAILDFPFDKDGHLTIDDFHVLAEQARELEAEVEVLRQQVADAEWAMRWAVEITREEELWVCRWRLSEDKKGIVTGTPTSTYWEVLHEARCVLERMNQISLNVYSPPNAAREASNE